MRQKIQTGHSKFSRTDRRVRSQLRRLKIVNIVFSRHGEAFGIGESFSGESPVVVGPKNDERRLSSPGDHDRAGEGGSLNLADVFHERDFGDKTKSLLSPLVTGSKSSSVSAQEVS